MGKDGCGLTKKYQVFFSFWQQERTSTDTRVSRINISQRNSARVCRDTEPPKMRLRICQSARDASGSTTDAELEERLLLSYEQC